jgi:hypothetical protein
MCNKSKLPQDDNIQDMRRIGGTSPQIRTFKPLRHLLNHPAITLQPSLHWNRPSSQTTWLAVQYQRLAKVEWVKGLHTNEDDVCVKYYAWKTDRAGPGKHTLRFHEELTSDKAPILVQAWTKHCGLNAYLFRKKLADSSACECEHADETVLLVLLHYDRYAEARQALREAASERWVTMEVLQDLTKFEYVRDECSEF